MKNEESLIAKRQSGEAGKDYSWLLTKLSYYIFLAFTFGSAVILALLYFYLWWRTGLLGLVIVFASLVLSRWCVARLVDHPSWFNEYPKVLKSLQGVNKFLGWFHRYLGALHGIHARAVRVVGKQFIAMPWKTKLLISLGALVIFVGVSGIMTWNTVKVVRAKLPYGRERFSMTSEELATRKANRVEQAKFAVWGKGNAEKSALCMEKYQPLIYAEAKKQGITPERFEGQLFVEGFCNTDLVNAKSGAAGFAQLLLSVGCERDLVMDAGFCKEVLQRAGTKNQIKFIPKGSKIVDRRLDPSYAIPVAADIIGDSARYWGDENWGFVEFHMGMGNLKKLVMYYLDETTPGWRKKYPANFSQTRDPNGSIAKAVREAGISYDDIFFRSTPNRTPKTYELLFSLADSSATYVYTGLAATEGFALMRTDRKGFLAMIKDQQDPDGGLANRPMRAWWSNSDAKYQTRTDVEHAFKQGELVALKSSSKSGFVLRTKGPDRIGECDSGNEASYYFTRKATAGLIYLLASRVKELGGNTLEITGLVRTNEMYDKPVRVNGQGCLPQTQPRTHVIGVAFDIGARINGEPMSEKTRDALEFVIMDLRADGVMDRIKEGTADHFVYNPKFQQELEGVYDRAMSGTSPVVTDPVP